MSSRCARLSAARNVLTSTTELTLFYSTILARSLLCAYYKRASLCSAQARGEKAKEGEDEDEDKKEKLKPDFNLPKEGERGHGGAVVKGQFR